MSRTALLCLLLVAAGCRVERRPPETLAEAGPPVAAGDTARVTVGEAARPEVVPVPSETPSGEVPSVELPSAPVAASGLAMPVAGVVAADLVDTYEAARSEGRTHDALDILAPRGTPVVAVADGEVLRLFESDRGGLTVYHLGADGRTVYYYAHLDAWAPGLAAGQTLRRGDAVGTVGDSGNAVPGNTHLHFAIWTVDDPASFWDGEPVNPYGLLSGR